MVWVTYMSVVSSILLVFIIIFAIYKIVFFYYIHRKNKGIYKNGSISEKPKINTDKNIDMMLYSTAKFDFNNSQSDMEIRINNSGQDNDDYDEIVVKQYAKY